VHDVIITLTMALCRVSAFIQECNTRHGNYVRLTLWYCIMKGSRACVVTRTYSTFGDRTFAAAGPGIWNSSIAPERGGLIVQ